MARFYVRRLEYWDVRHVYNIVDGESGNTVEVLNTRPAADAICKLMNETNPAQTGHNTENDNGLV